MTKIPWDGIPEQYWPDTEKPWRVSWGFGAFEDFPTEGKAQEFYDELVADEQWRAGGWDKLVQLPWNAVEGSE